ncbi:competence type IV pilus minor pilin ComGF [Enterococcus sp. PF1-24]|uniref:competence type IV pilus minor pilin ComGF n=1 Tax=Enterococcus sp. PF1-24 TaxID=1742399 RepID=UPI0024734E88|nr:competence type IV pilus minor pilin ComGF [Enterococcus sp. PF1-24]
MLESLLALLVLGGMLVVFSALLQMMQGIQRNVDNASEKEFDVFLLQLELELKDTQLTGVYHNQIHFNKAEEDFHIKQVGSRVDKRKGTQPLLTDVKTFSVNQVNQTLEIEVVFKDETHCQGKWILPRE